MSAQARAPRGMEQRLATWVIWMHSFEDTDAEMRAALLVELELRDRVLRAVDALTRRGLVVRAEVKQ